VRVAPEEACSNPVEVEAYAISASDWQQQRGCADIYLRDGIIQEYLAKDDDTGGSLGVVSAFSKIRGKEGRRLLVTNANAIPKDETIQAALSCYDAHFGVCVTRDVELYSTIDTMATAVASYFTTHKLHGFYQLRNSAGDVDAFPPIYVHFCYRRTRKPTIYVTHQFVSLERIGRELQYDEADARFKFLTNWTLSKQMATLKWTIVQVHQIVLERACGRIRISRDQDLVEGGVQIWPAPARGKTSDGLSKLDPPKRSAKKAKGGITYAHPRQAWSCGSGGESSDSGGSKDTSIGGAGGPADDESGAEKEKPKKTAPAPPEPKAKKEKEENT